MRAATSSSLTNGTNNRKAFSGILNDDRRLWLVNLRHVEVIVKKIKTGHAHIVLDNWPTTSYHGFAEITHQDPSNRCQLTTAASKPLQHDHKLHTQKFWARLFGGHLKHHNMWLMNAGKSFNFSRASPGRWETIAGMQGKVVRGFGRRIIHHHLNGTAYCFDDQQLVDPMEWDYRHDRPTGFQAPHPYPFFDLLELESRSTWRRILPGIHPYICTLLGFIITVPN